MASSFFQRQNLQVGGPSAGRMPDSVYNPLFYDQRSRLVGRNDEEESHNAEIEFLEQQKKETEDGYRTWLKFYVACSILFTVFGAVLGVLWLRWGIIMNHDGRTCINLKNQIILLSLVYLLGFLGQLAGTLVAFLRVLLGLIMYGMFEMIILVAKVFIDTDALNLASDVLGGCTKTTIQSLTGYIIATILFDVLLVILLILTGIIIFKLKKSKKANKILQEYREKTQKEPGIQINI